MVTILKGHHQLPLWQRSWKSLSVQWRILFLAMLGILYLIRQVTDPSNRIALNLWMDQMRGTDPIESLQWATQYETGFPFTVQNTADCAKILEDPALLQSVAQAAVKDWKQRQKDSYISMTSTMEQASQTWNQAMIACHGVLPSSIESELTLRAFMDGLAKCGDPYAVQMGGMPNLFGGEWCVGDWRHYLRPAFTSWMGSSALQSKFVDSARCALHLEFPLDTSLAIRSSTSPQHINNPRPLDWKPKRTILLALTMGRAGPTMACKLVTTAYPRGWDVVLVEGSYRGYKYKYTYALKALKVLLEASDIPASETLVVFADAKDVLVQEAPQQIVNSFSKQPHDFVFSSEPLCFPLGTWPHSLGIPHHTCDGLFPEPTGTPIVQGRKFVNTGGWIGLASSAVVVLKEMVLTVEHRPDDAVCHSWGTDQLLGNAAFLRHQSLLGLDTDYAVFASGAWGLVQYGALQYSNDNQAYCQSSEMSTCPGMLHFNGGGDEGGSFQQAYDVLTSKDSLPTCNSKKGSVSVVNINTGRIQTLADDSMGAKFGSVWKQCLKGKACFSG